MPDVPLFLRFSLLALALLILLLAFLVVAGATTLVGWGTALTFRTRGTRLTRLGWNVLFFILPGPTHLVFALTRPAPRRFRILALGVSLSIVGFLIAVGTALAIMWMVGIPIKAGGR